MTTSLEILRIKQGFSQSDLAKITGVSQSTLSLIEKEGRRARPKAMKAIADALGVDVFDIEEFANPKESRLAAMKPEAD